MEKGDLRSIGGFRGDPQGEVREKALSKAELLMILRDYITRWATYFFIARLCWLTCSHLKANGECLLSFFCQKGQRKFWPVLIIILVLY